MKARLYSLARRRGLAQWNPLVRPYLLLRRGASWYLGVHEQ